MGYIKIFVNIWPNQLVLTGQWPSLTPFHSNWSTVVSTGNKWKGMQRLDLIPAWCPPGKQDAASGRCSTRSCTGTLPGHTDTHESQQAESVAIFLNRDGEPDLEAEPGIRRHHVVKQLDHFFRRHRAADRPFCVDSESTLTTCESCATRSECGSELSRSG